jgi:glycosyltransferase involved in cell wall biosynthesis
MTAVRAEGVQSRPSPEESEATAAFLAAHPPGGGAPLAIVIAAYDEEHTVAGVVASLPPEVAGLATEAIVVVDGAGDGTAAAAASAGALVCDVQVNRGQGAALRLGYLLARRRGARVIATIDADGQYDPGDLACLVEPILAGEADFVSGSRRLGTELTTDPVRQAGIRVFAALISVLIRSRITDPAFGLRAMRAEVVEAVTLRQPQYQASELLIAAAMCGFRVAEVPATIRARPAGAGATKKGGNLLYGVRFARVVIGTWWRERTSVRRRPENTQTS